MSTPRPSLTYDRPRDAAWLGWDIAGDGPMIDNVREVTVHGHSGDVWVMGRMLCKDWHVGPNRCQRVYCDQPQPEWLREVIADGLARLTAPLPDSTPCDHDWDIAGAGPPRCIECGETVPPTAAEIDAAMRVLADVAIPFEHEPDDPNCGECWQCIYATLSIAHVLKSERHRAARGSEQ